MPASRPPVVPGAAEPLRGQVFDPWNSSSTGHQHAENRLGASTGWRDSRNRKLMSQFAGGAGGGRRVSDTVGEGARDWDPRAGGLVTPAMRSRAHCSVLDMLARPGTMKKQSTLSESSSSRPAVPPGGSREEEEEGRSGGLLRFPDERTAGEQRLGAERKAEEDEAREQAGPRPRPRKIFDGVVVYLNGSTHPLISDHKLRHVLAEHGGSMSSHLGRRRVTHVILGRPAAAGAGAGAGGGLAGGKLQREIARTGGAGVKYVGVQWVLESIRAGRRLPEARFADLKIAARGQSSVYGLFSGREGQAGEGKGEEAAAMDPYQPPPSGQA
ncbi:BRCA1 C terminus domain-containing protein [Xylaria palmicola]|nr:BRCA1 C terminus domain-containing protein [Xylaria palmicola]